jgi:transposase
MKDGRTRLGYKPEHAVDLDTGAILAAPVHHADPGHHRRECLEDLHDGRWKTRISEPAPSGRNGIHRWHGDDDARKAVDANRERLRSSVARRAFKLGAEIVDRSFALTLDRGGMRRTWLRGQDDIQKRYPIHITGHDLALIMRLPTGSGTPRRWASTDLDPVWPLLAAGRPSKRPVAGDPGR